MSGHCLYGCPTSIPFFAKDTLGWPQCCEAPGAGTGLLPFYWVSTEDYNHGVITCISAVRDEAQRFSRAFLPVHRAPLSAWGLVSFFCPEVHWNLVLLKFPSLGLSSHTSSASQCYQVTGSYQQLHSCRKLPLHFHRFEWCWISTATSSPAKNDILVDKSTTVFSAFQETQDPAQLTY